MIERPPLAAVLGWPIAHSLSPRVHGHWLHRYGLTGYYIPIGLPPAAFEEGFRSLPLLGFRGVNVTIPHKEAAFALATVRTPRAEAIGAANTITFRPNGAIHADNTDGYGFLANLRQHAPDWDAAAGPALVLGSGGSARAIIAALLDAGVPELRLANRNRDRAEGLHAHFGAGVRVVDWADAAEAAASAATIVNTTPVGMGDEAIPIDLRAARSGTLVADIVYGAEPTAFIAEGKRLGLPVVDGLGMLLHQAAPGFEAWFGRRPEVDDALRAAVLAR
jgi:shikimate dehydrogenase